MSAKPTSKKEKISNEQIVKKNLVNAAKFLNHKSMHSFGKSKEIQGYKAMMALSPEENPLTVVMYQAYCCDGDGNIGSSTSVQNDANNAAIIHHSITGHTVKIINSNE